jgi:hypothetical protein
MRKQAVRYCALSLPNGNVIKSTVVMRLSSQGKNVTPTSVEESSDDCKSKNVHH